MSRKALLAEAVPSLTVIVMVAVPVWFVTGVIVTVRLAPEPPKSTFVLGTRAGLDDVPLTERFAVGLTTSLTVKLIGGVAVLRTMAWSAMAEMVGPSVTTIRTVLVAINPKVSATVSVAV